MIRFLHCGPIPALLVTVGLLALAPSPGLAHYIDLRGKLVEDDVLTLGIALSGRPFAYREKGTVQGFEIDFAREVAHSRGLELSVKTLPRGELADALHARRVDLVATLPLEVLPEGTTLVPYLALGDHVMILAGNPFGIEKPLDLAGHTVAALAGSSAEAFAREVDRQLVAAGREAMAIHTFPYQRDVHFPVSMGHAAAYFVQSRTALVA
ncbi:MAG TPA: transporter substrate-binding domain-containing protein, partial [Kiloniellales bacterium]|nr:transporter substrate-binding domain-containing protein [Kiloniellales bacterium]